MFMISLPIFICLVFLSKDILILLYGTEYASGAIALLIISGGILSNCLIGPASDALIGAGKTKAPLISLGTGCISNIFLNIFLIPKYGINGAATATCISMFIARFTIARLNYKYLKILPVSGIHFAWAAISGLLIPVFILFKKTSSGHLLIDISISGSIYLLINYLLLLCIIRFTDFGKKWFSELNFLMSS
jgi:O-antigen/teichoic acid export membrane protein